MSSITVNFLINFNFNHKFIDFKSKQECERACDGWGLWCSHFAWNPKKSRCTLVHDRNYCGAEKPIKAKNKGSITYVKEDFVHTDKTWKKLDGMCYSNEKFLIYF